MTTNSLPMITGIGYAVPNKVVTNDDLTHLYETSDEWIYTRTGIKERRIFASDDEAFDLLRQAAEQAVKNAGIDVEFHKYRNVGHGFGSGRGTSAEGWIGRADAFLAKL